jgi:hypothetical protein
LASPRGFKGNSGLIGNNDNNPFALPFCAGAGQLKGIKWVSEQMVKSMAAVTALFAVSTASMAENCTQYPEGRARFQCASQKNPALLGKQERCKQQGLATGLRQSPALRDFVMACMRRPG